MVGVENKCCPAEGVNYRQDGDNDLDVDDIILVITMFFMITMVIRLMIDDDSADSYDDENFNQT